MFTMNSMLSEIVNFINSDVKEKDGVQQPAHSSIYILSKNVYIYIKCSVKS